MALTVDFPASSYDLTTVDAVVAALSLSPSDQASNSQYIGTLIKRASSFISTYTNRVFAKETVTETLTSNGGPRLVLSRTPIISINSVTYNNITVISSSEYEIEDADAGFLWRERGWTNTLIDVGGINPIYTRFGKYKWKVSYTAGFVLPPSQNVTLPGELEQACIEIVKSWYLGRKRDTSVIRESIGEASVTYADVTRYAAAIPITAKEILNKWIKFD